MAQVQQSAMDPMKEVDSLREEGLLGGGVVHPRGEKAQGYLAMGKRSDRGESRIQSQTLLRPVQ